jgi:hypothetical protein
MVRVKRPIPVPDEGVILLPVRSFDLMKTISAPLKGNTIVGHPDQKAGREPEYSQTK